MKLAICGPWEQKMGPQSGLKAQRRQLIALLDPLLGPDLELLTGCIPGVELWAGTWAVENEVPIHLFLHGVPGSTNQDRCPRMKDATTAQISACQTDRWYANRLDLGREWMSEADTLWVWWNGTRRGRVWRIMRLARYRNKPIMDISSGTPVPVVLSGPRRLK